MVERSQRLSSGRGGGGGFESLFFCSALGGGILKFGMSWG